MEQLAAQIADNAGVDVSVVMDMAESCARRLSDWYGSPEAAIDGVQGNEGADIVCAAVEDHVRAFEAFAVKAHMHPAITAEAVLAIINGRGE